MKQVIVLISSILLGIALGTMIVGFEGTAQQLADAATARLSTLHGLV